MKKDRLSLLLPLLLAGVAPALGWTFPQHLSFCTVALKAALATQVVPSECARNIHKLVSGIELPPEADVLMIVRNMGNEDLVGMSLKRKGDSIKWPYHVVLALGRELIFDFDYGEGTTFEQSSVYFEKMFGIQLSDQTKDIQVIAIPAATYREIFEYEGPHWETEGKLMVIKNSGGRVSRFSIKSARDWYLNRT